MKGNCFGKKLGFPKMNIQFGKGIFSQKIFIFEIMKEGFQAGNFALDRFRLILSVQECDKEIHSISRPEII